jgi:hypothetical protein
MDSLTREYRIAEQVLQDVANRFPIVNGRNITAFDREHGQFILLREGWDGYKRTHYAWIHIELRDGKFWIHRDGTEYGIANDLIEAGIPKEKIVLAFQHLVRRERGEFAVT